MSWLEFCFVMARMTRESKGESFLGEEEAKENQSQMKTVTSMTKKGREPKKGASFKGELC